MRIKETKVYQFAELSDAAKEKAREWYRQGNWDDSFWSELTLSDLKETAKLLGIDADHIDFSGFWSQGDGACFVGRYSYPGKGSLAKLRAEYPATWRDRQTGEVHECKGNQELIEIAETLADIQRRHFYSISARVTHTGHYHHENSVSIDACCDCRRCNGDTDGDACEAIADALRDFMRHCYKTLEREWEWLNADEQVDESITCNEYEFTEEGEIA
jgi:hypothetical protein